MPNHQTENLRLFHILFMSFFFTFGTIFSPAHKNFLTFFTFHILSLPVYAAHPVNDWLHFNVEQNQQGFGLDLASSGRS